MSLKAFARDESGIVVSWLLRLLVGLALVGVVLFDAGSIVVNYVSLDGAADEIALEVAANLAVGADVVPNLECHRASRVPACRSVFEQAKERGVKIVTARFDQEGAFHLKVKRTADTWIVGRIGAIEDWAKATASAQADTN